MGSPSNYDEWQPIRQSDEPRDQQRDLFGPYWAEVGPDSPDRGWSWTILDASSDASFGNEAAGGFAPTEDEVKAAVTAWEQQYLLQKHHEAHEAGSASLQDCPPGCEYTHHQ